MMSNIIKDNTIISWYDGKAIVIDENDELSYYEMPEEYAYKGEPIDSHQLRPISELSAKEIIDIMDHLAEDQHGI